MAEVLPLVRLTAVEVIGDYLLRITFENGFIGDVSYEDTQWRGVFEPFRDPAVFARVALEPRFGTLCWPEYGLDMAPEPIYQAALQNPVVPARSGS